MIDLELEPMTNVDISTTEDSASEDSFESNKPTCLDPKQCWKNFFKFPPCKEIKRTAIIILKSRKWFINLFIIFLHLLFYLLQDKWMLMSKLEFQPSNKQKVWRYFTYSLIHIDWVHLLGNSVFQLCFGTALEPVHGVRVVFIYIGGVLSGSLFHFIMNHGSTLSGASAGVTALILAWIPDVVLNCKKQLCPWFSFVLVVIYTAWQVFMKSSTTSRASHFSGGLTGFLMGFGILKKLKKNQTFKYEKWMRGIAISLYGVCLVGLIILNCLDSYT